MSYKYIYFLAEFGNPSEGYNMDQVEKKKLQVVFQVKRSAPELVHEAAGGDIGKDYYYLSNLDQNLAATMKTVHIYRPPPTSPEVKKKSTESAARVIRDALSRVLVHYYPFTGTLAIGPDGKLVVRCDRRGVPFVEASSDADIDTVGDVSVLDDPDKLLKLVYNGGAGDLLDTPLLAVQVTRFRCGGFVLGVAMSHCLADGVSAAEFLRSWAEMARGLPLSVPPFMDRRIQSPRSPPRIEFAHHEFDEVVVSGELDTGEFSYRSFSFDTERIAELKLSASEDGNGMCSGFVALTAFIWRARTEALGMSGTAKLLFAVDGRRRTSPPLPEGFFGNGVVMACCVMDAGELVSWPVSRVASEVRAAARGVTGEYIASAIDCFEVARARPSMSGTMLVTAWTRLGFGSAADFGFGPAEQSGPAELPGKEVALILPRRNDKGVVVVMGLPASCMGVFEQLISRDV